MFGSWHGAIFASTSTTTTVVTMHSGLHLPVDSLISRMLLSLVALDTAGSSFYLKYLVVGTVPAGPSVISKLTAKVGVHSYSLPSLPSVEFS